MALECLWCYLTQQDIPRTFSIAKYVYLVCFTLIAIITWVLRDFGDQWFLDNVGVFSYCQQAQYEGLCSGKQVAVRMSFGNFTFFAFHALVLAFCKRETDVRAGFHTSMWVPKLFLWAGTILGFFFIPTDAVVTYAQVARFGSGLFLIFQMIDMVNFIYVANEWLTLRDTRAAWAVLICGSATSLLLGLGLIGASYYFYAPSASCSLNVFFITWSLIVMFAMIGVLFVPGRAPTAGLLTTGTAFAYVSYLLFSALNSEPANECIHRIDTGGSGWVTVVGFFIAIFVVSFATMATGAGSSWARKDYEAAPDVLDLPYRPDFFHIMFALASMYFAMLFTNWDIGSSTNRFQLDQGWVSTWVKMGSKWFCEAIYIWSVVAPAVFPDRDFGGLYYVGP